ncbi:hypothetical protein [Polyangium aurulentum]|uniref:hypothetical protein n=1 Tax=Polyangium aurulentum TaxID=2567896 RepID=UPI0010ADF836|nr:hypothetical protein [Polyangium aurulentum]UQA61390.1 hypothetical protein E8A73_013310 [Polyangium aurulentum]
MIGEAVLPETVRVEVKTTTADFVVVSARELEALRTTNHRAPGVLAVLFWCGDRRIDGRWMVVDAGEMFGKTSVQTRRVTKDAMARVIEHQPWLKGIKVHLDQHWRRFLRAFQEEALISREALHAELVRCHAEETVEERLPSDTVLEAEHREAVATVIARHGEAAAGRIFQDLFAYLLAHAGYRKVTVNPVGVPDVVVSDLQRPEESRRMVQVGLLEVAEVRRLAQYCRKAGDLELAERLTAYIGGNEP